ncbi:MAG: hypothetical protein KC731_27225 [Myxococcales bacterium]|nr:hypothetical protein [Myxococcales bacterium]
MPWSYAEIAFGIAIVAVSAAVTTGFVVAFVVVIEPDHFIARRKDRIRRIESPLARGAYFVAKNLLGVLLIIAGIVLSLPGIPGPGLVTIAIGLLLTDLPHKRRFVLSLVRRPPIHRTLDRIRARFDKPPLRLEGPPLRPDVEPER